MTALVDFLRARGVRLFLPHVRGDGLEVVECVPCASSSGTAAVPADPLAAGPVTDPRLVGLALVPGLAFDQGGGRLGRGGGHYDRLLARLRADCLRVGVCFSGQLVARVPRDPWDQSVDVVATEDGVHEGGGGGGGRSGGGR